jgi:O-antigen ligase
MNNFDADFAYRPSACARESNSARAGVISWTVAYLFVFAIGSGAASYYSEISEGSRAAGYTILVGGLWFGLWAILSRRGRAVLGDLLTADILLWFTLVALPVVYMIFDDRSFTRGDWTSHLSYPVILFVGAVLGLRRDLRGSVTLAVFTVIVVGVALNLFELLVHNNLWSTAPGRSAGFYVNPNGSSAALALFGILYFTFRQDSYRRFDVLVLALIFAGVLATFSRGGFLLFFICVFACLISRTGVRLSWATVRTGVALALGLALVGLLAFSVVLPQLSLTQDAAIRLQSIEDNALVRDYGTDRFGGVTYAWAMFRESPMTGVGVLSSLEMEDGPHNMLAGLAMDMGVIPLLLYVWLILRMIWLGVSGLRGPTAVSGAWLVGLWLLGFSFSSHNVIYDTFALLGLGIALSCFFGSRGGRSRAGAQAG